MPFLMQYLALYTLPYVFLYYGRKSDDRIVCIDKDNVNIPKLQFLHVVFALLGL